MKIKALWKPLLFYTGFLGCLTVGAVYFATHSGLFMVMLAGVGVVLVALGAGAAGKVNAAPTEDASEDWIETGDSNSARWSPPNTGASRRLTLLFYGLGVLLWSLVVLGTVPETLV